MWLIWLIAAGVFFIGEIATTGFFFFLLGIASVLAMIVSIFTDNIIIQTTVFVFSSVALILATKPLISKYVTREKKCSNQCL